MASRRASRRVSLTAWSALAGTALGLWLGIAAPWREARGGDDKPGPGGNPPAAGTHLAPDTDGAYDPAWDKPYPQYQPVGTVLKPFPVLAPGDIVPQELYRYGGRGAVRTAVAACAWLGIATRRRVAAAVSRPSRPHPVARFLR